MPGIPFCAGLQSGLQLDLDVELYARRPRGQHRRSFLLLRNKLFVFVMCSNQTHDVMHVTY